MLSSIDDWIFVWLITWNNGGSLFPNLSLDVVYCIKWAKERSKMGWYLVFVPLINSNWVLKHQHCIIISLDMKIPPKSSKNPKNPKNPPEKPEKPAWKSQTGIYGNRDPICQPCPSEPNTSSLCMSKADTLPSPSSVRYGTTNKLSWSSKVNNCRQINACFSRINMRLVHMDCEPSSFILDWISTKR